MELSSSTISETHLSFLSFFLNSTRSDSVIRLYLFCLEFFYSLRFSEIVSAKEKNFTQKLKNKIQLVVISVRNGGKNIEF
jgi:hypothetical protein